MPKPGAKTVGDSRPPRAHVEYEVFTGNARKTVELPFVVGVLSDLSGKSKEKLPPPGQRVFEEVGPAGLAPLFKKLKPRVAFDVENTTPGPDGKLSGQMMKVEVEFESMEDFFPDRVARRVEALRGLVEQRERLQNLISYLDGNDDAEAVLQDVLKKIDALKS